MRVLLLVENQLLRETIHRFLNNGPLQITCEEMYPSEMLLTSPWDVAIADSAGLGALKTQLNSLRTPLLVNALRWESSLEDLLNVLRGNALSKHMHAGDLVAVLPVAGQPVQSDHSPAFWVLRAACQSLGASSVAHSSL